MKARIKTSVARGWDEFCSWHRSLPDPPDKPNLDWKLLKKTFHANNEFYFKGLKIFYSGMLTDWGAAAAERRKQQEREEKEREEEAEAAAKALAEGVKVTAEEGPAAFRRWIAPRLALFSDALLEFGKGFREGKNVPDAKIDIKEWLGRSDKKT